MPPILFLFLLLSAASARAADALPEPLSLRAALSLAVAGAHPSLAEAQALARRADARLAVAEADDDWRLAADARLRFIDPASDAANQSNNDSSIGLRLEKRLYDFGRTGSAIASARRAAEGRRLELLDARHAYLLKVLRAYFDVILADLAYVRDNEAMSIQFVRLDKQRDGHELGRVSDLALLRAEDDYQRIRAARAASELRQRLMRQRLANLLNHPGELPSDLEEPRVMLAGLAPPEFDAVLERALRDNPRLRALQARVEAALAARERARGEEGPVIRARLAARAWQRDSASRNPFSAELRFELPLSSGGRRSAALAEAGAGLELARARLDAYRLQLRERVLDRLLAISRLKVALERQQVLAERRDLELDRARALYEMEVNADLGDSMVRVSAAHLESARTEYELALAWVELKLLSGEDLNEQRILALLAGEDGAPADQSVAGRRPRLGR